MLMKILHFLNIGIPPLQCVSDQCKELHNPFGKQCYAPSDCENLPNTPANVTLVCDDIAMQCILPCSDVNPCPFGDGISNFVYLRI